ncbi:MAG: hypothetical protein V4510_12695 [bacterium]
MTTKAWAEAFDDNDAVVLTVTLSRDEAVELSEALGSELYDLWSAGITEPIYDALDRALGNSHE